MNEPDVNEHLSGVDLEALAAGQAASSQQTRHLGSCTRCHDALSAMRAENRLFANEFSRENTDMDLAIDARKATPTAGAYKPFIMYTVAASIMLACALALIWSGKHKNDDTAEAVIDNKKDNRLPAEKKSDDPPEVVKEDEDPKPARDAFRPPEDVYEGKTAKQWAAQLKAGAGDQKAAHALTEIGRDALPVVLDLLRDPGGSDAFANSAAQNAELVRGMLKNMRLEKDDLTQFVSMLKDEKFEVRRGAVDLLGTLAEQQPVHTEAVKAALNQAMKDRDKAVVEAARNQLESIRDAAEMKVRAVEDQKKKAEQDAIRAEQQAVQHQAKLVELKKALDLAALEHKNAKAALENNAITNAEYQSAKIKFEAATAELEAFQRAPQKATVGEGDIDR